MKPQRIQIRRTKGWRMPPNTVKVDRTTKWGNPFRVGLSTPMHCNTAAEAVIEYRVWMTQAGGRSLDLSGLRGKNLACWCPLTDEHGNRVPCHADVLLELANA